MIPSVKRWNVRVHADEHGPEEIFPFDGPTMALVRIGFRMDYPRYWGRKITISLDRKTAKR
jgi:hypothetical protein